MGAFDKFKTATPMGVRQWIEAGNHVLLIKRVFQGPSRNPTKKNQENTIVEFKIVESDTMKVGATCSLVETDNQAGYAGNVLSFVSGVMGIDTETMQADPDFDDVFQSVFGEDQILVGMLVRVVAQQVKTQAGGDYTAKTWEPVEAASYENYNLIAPNGAYVAEAEAA